MIGTTHLKRVFEVNGTQIPCQTPHLPLKESVRVLAQEYPQFRHTRVFDEDGKVEGDKLVYKLILPPPKSNG